MNKIIQFRLNVKLLTNIAKPHLCLMRKLKRKKLKNLVIRMKKIFQITISIIIDFLKLELSKLKKNSAEIMRSNKHPIIRYKLLVILYAQAR